jgi:hypothetical protein
MNDYFTCSFIPILYPAIPYYAAHCAILSIKKLPKDTAKLFLKIKH